MPRRIYIYRDDGLWEAYNLMSTIGSYVMGARLPLPPRRDREERQRAACGQRPLAGRHARVVHDLAAAAAQLRRRSVRDERAPALRPAPPAARAESDEDRPRARPVPAPALLAGRRDRGGARGRQRGAGARPGALGRRPRRAAAPRRRPGRGARRLPAARRARGHGRGPDARRDRHRWPRRLDGQRWSMAMRRSRGRCACVIARDPRDVAARRGAAARPLARLRDAHEAADHVAAARHGRGRDVRQRRRAGPAASSSRRCWPASPSPAAAQARSTTSSTGTSTG